MFGWVDMPQIVYLLILDGHLICFHFLALISNVATNIHMQVFVFLGVIAKSSATLYLTLGGELLTVFQGGCIILPSRQQCVRIPVSPHLHQHWL